MNGGSAAVTTDKNRGETPSRSHPAIGGKELQSISRVRKGGSGPNPCPSGGHVVLVHRIGDRSDKGYVRLV